MEENKTLVGNVGTEQKEAATETNKEEKKEPVTLAVEPSEFDADAEVIFLTGSMLREKINNMFRAVFADFDSCTLQVNTQNSIDVVSNSFALGALYVDLHFKRSGGIPAWLQSQESQESYGRSVESSYLRVQHDLCSWHVRLWHLWW